MVEKLKEIFVAAMNWLGFASDKLHEVEVDLEEFIDNSPIQLASIIGRYYAMDRDKRWERTKKAYDLLVHGEGKHYKNGIRVYRIKACTL